MARLGPTPTGARQGVISATGSPRPASLADRGDRAAGLHGCLGRADQLRAEALTATSRSSTLSTSPQNLAGPSGRPARSTTSTISGPRRWKPWRISPDLADPLQRRPSGRVDRRARALEVVGGDDHVIEPDRAERVLGEQRGRRSDWLGRQPVDRRLRRRRRARQRPSRDPRRASPVEPDAGAEQRDQPVIVDDQPEPAPRLDAVRRRSATRPRRHAAGRRGRAGRRGTSGRRPARRPACDRLADAVPGAALLEQQDRPLVLARTPRPAAARPSCGRAAGRRGCRPRPS